MKVLSVEVVRTLFEVGPVTSDDGNLLSAVVASNSLEMRSVGKDVTSSMSSLDAVITACIVDMNVVVFCGDSIVVGAKVGVISIAGCIDTFVSDVEAVVNGTEGVIGKREEYINHEVNV